MKYHPNLDPKLVDRINECEAAGGIFLKDIPNNTIIDVQTGGRIYKIHKHKGKTTITGHPKYCSVPTECWINGSTYGGSMIKVGWLGISMYLEFGTKKHPSITTSQIRGIVILTPETIDHEEATP